MRKNFETQVATRTVRRVLSFQEAKERLGLRSNKALYQRVHRGQVPVHRNRSRLVFFEDEIDQFLASLPGVTVEEAIARVEVD